MGIILRPERRKNKAGQERYFFREDPLLWTVSAPGKHVPIIPATRTWKNPMEIRHFVG